MNQITIAVSASLGAQPMEISSMKHGMVTSNTRAKKVDKILSLQGFRFIATKFIDTTIFCCNKMIYYHKFPWRGNMSHILRQFSFVALSTFVAIEAAYCNKLLHRCNMVVILQQLCFCSINSSFCSIETRYCNNINLCCNILKRIATILAGFYSSKYCCKRCHCIAIKYALVVIAHFFASISLFCNSYYILRQIVYSW
jgi:hypothetical protein